MHLWRNRLARSAVNRKVGGSNPPRCDFFSFFFPADHNRTTALLNVRGHFFPCNLVIIPYMYVFVHGRFVYSLISIAMKLYFQCGAYTYKRTFFPHSACGDN